MPINGGFESPEATRLGSSRQQAYFNHPGWRSVHGTWAAQSGSYYKVSPYQGQHFLRPSSRDGSVCELAQDIPINSFGSKPPKMILTQVSMRTGTGKDRTEAVFELLGSDNTVIRSVSSQLQKDTAWTTYNSCIRVPESAKTLRIRLIGHHRSGKITDAFFDEIQTHGAGPGYPASLSTKSSKDLISEHGSTADANRRNQLLIALAGSNEQGAGYLAALLREEKDASQRPKLLQLLLVSGHKVAAAPIRAALTGSDTDRKTVLEHIDLAPFDWAGQVAKLANQNSKHRLEYLEALAQHGAFQKLNTIFGISRSNESRLMILKALRKGSFTAEQLKPILSTNLHSGGNEDQRYESMRLLAQTGSPRYLKILESICKADTSLTHRGNYLRWAAGYNSVAAIKAMLPLVNRRIERCRGAFLQWVPSMDDETVGNWIRTTAVQSRDELLRQTAIASLRQQPRTGDAEILLKLSKDAEQSVAVAAIAGLNGETNTARNALTKILGGKKGPQAAAAITALAQSDSFDSGIEGIAARAATSNKHWQVRVAALAILAASAARHREIIVENLAHPIRQVRTAAIQALARARDKNTIETLLTRMGKERSTTRAFVAESLVSLTGVDKGNDAKLWQSWWSTVKANFTVPSITASKSRTALKSTATISTFYDLPVDTDNIVFVIDVSGSMKDEVRGDTKLATAKDEVVKVLIAMTKGQRKFNIVTFGTEPHSYQKTLQKASKDNIRKATNWIMRLETKGWTNIHDSLSMAMMTPGVESIFLLSDGAPSTGRYVEMKQVHDTITARNRSLMIRINTIAVGGDKRSRRFMKKLAEENFGKNRDHN